MNKRVYLILIVMIMSASALAACGRTATVQYIDEVPQTRVAVYTTSVTLDDTYPNLDDYRDYYGKWQIQFEDEKHFRAILNSQEVVQGDYHLSANEVQFFDRAGP